jgi:hypothetical protein
MVNHLRTLLLNRSASPATEDLPDGEQYVPLSFSPLELTGVAAQVYRAVFQSVYPRSYANFIVNLLGSVVYSNDYASYLELMDSRLSYDPVHLTLQSLKPGNDLTLGINAGAFKAYGTYIPAEDIGVYEDTWTLQRQGPAALLIYRKRDGLVSNAVVTFISPDTSARIPLGSGIEVQFVGQAGGAVPNPFLATLRSYSPMRYSITDCLARIQGVTGLDELFTTQIASWQSAMDTLRSLVSNNLRPDLQLSGALIAYALKVSEIYKLYTL